MMKTTLLIMAAGIGSRFGTGIKQLEPVDASNHIIMDYSIHDAIEAGFNHVVFIIRKDIEKEFKEVIGDLLRCKDGLASPPRLCPAFRQNSRDVVDILESVVHSYIMSRADSGGVTRGICKMDDQNNLTEVVETKNIVKSANGAEAEGVAVDVNSLVSMNMWGLTPDFLDVLEEGFKEFFEKEVPGNPQKAEYLIPIFIGELLEQGKMSVKVLKTNDTWYGMTYHEDVAAVKDSFKKMLENGVYKADLFSDL